jgi:hypothetical protein
VIWGILVIRNIEVRKMELMAKGGISSLKMYRFIVVICGGKI